MGKSFLEKPVGELLKALAALPVFLLLAACNHWGGLSPEARPLAFFTVFVLRGRSPFLPREAEAFASFSVFVLRTKAFALPSRHFDRSARPARGGMTSVWPRRRRIKTRLIAINGHQGISPLRFASVEMTEWGRIAR